MFIPWSGLKPTFRGKEKEHADPINLRSLKRMSIMMRRYSLLIQSWIISILISQHSFFGDQEGPFSLTLRSISAVASSPVEPSKLEQGDATAAACSTGRLSRYIQSFRVSRTNQIHDSTERCLTHPQVALSPWRICGLALVGAALFYLQHSTSRAA